MNGPQIEAYFADVTQHAMNFNLQQYLNAANRNFFGLRFDRNTGVVAPLFGNPSAALLQTLAQQQLRPRNVAGGYRVAAGQSLAAHPAITPANRNALNALPNDCDLFFIANDVLLRADPLVKALIFHESSHLYDQSQKNSLQITANGGQHAYASLTHPTFRASHTTHFFDIVAEAAPHLVAFDNTFTDELDLLSFAFQFDYEGNPAARMTALLQAVAQHHVAQNNAPTFYLNGYLPEIDAMYRTQVQKGFFALAPGHQATYQNQYARTCFTMPNPVFLKLQQQIAKLQP